MVKDRNAYFREYRKRNLKKSRKYIREYNRKWRKTHGCNDGSEWRKKNPEKFSAQQKARRALKAGKIKRKSCKKCGDKKAIMHHPDYSKPLKVEWLCKIDHRKIHYNMVK